MYREKIREYYDHLSRSYRRVADHILSNYYEVSFMTAAQLAFAVGVDTTTVVRFSQRIGYNGYPELLADIREQVRAEIYAAYLPKPYDPLERGDLFKLRTEQEQNNLAQMLIHNPPEHVANIIEMFNKAKRIILMGEGYAETVAQMAAEQFRHRGLQAEAVTGDPVKRAAALINLNANTLIIGISATAYGRDVARAMSYGRSKGCQTLGIIGSLLSPINRMSDQVVYAPTDAPGPLPSIVALTAALSALVAIASADSVETIEKQTSEFDLAYQFLVQPDVEAPEDEEEVKG